MPLRLQLTLHLAPLNNRLQALRTTDVPAWRRDAITSLARDLLARTITHNPVDTARARSSWGHSLEQLGGTPPPNWRGANSSLAAIAEGAEQSTLTITESATQTDIRATSRVPYIVYLELGTRRMPPAHMTRRSLTELRHTFPTRVPPLPHL